MGFDVYGKAPTSAEGKYFRRNAWRWPPLAQLLIELCPRETRACEAWMCNDGDGLNSVDAMKLARRLKMLRADGTIDAYCTEQNARAEAALDDMRERHPQLAIRQAGAESEEMGQAGDGSIICRVGNLTVIGEPSSQVGDPDDVVECSSIIMPLMSSLPSAFPVTAADVDEFIRFAAASGGFSIW
jgi:hypothetical protein